MLWLLPFLLLTAPAWAEKTSKTQPEIDFSMVAGLRGGYDTNPTDGPRPRERSAPSLVQTLSLDYNHRRDDHAYGLSLVTANTLQDGSVAPSLFNNSLTFSYRRKLRDRWLWTATLNGLSEQTWSRRLAAAVWRNRVDYFGEGYRLFSSLEGRYAHLNERNPLVFGGFLPDGETLASATVTPGMALVRKDGEIGVSGAVGRVSSLSDFDYLGLRRSHHRMQVNVFASLRLRGAAVEGSVSPFRADFDIPDFEPVRTLLYTGKATLPYRNVVFEAKSQRVANDTTFPFAALNIVTEHQATATAKLTDRFALAGYGRWKTESYQGLDLTILTRTVGLDAAYRFDGGWIGTATLAQRQISAGIVSMPSAYLVQVGFQKQLSLADLMPQEDGSKPPSSAR